MCHSSFVTDNMAQDSEGYSQIIFKWKTLTANTFLMYGNMAVQYFLFKSVKYTWKKKKKVVCMQVWSPKKQQITSGPWKILLTPHTVAKKSDARSVACGPCHGGTSLKTIWRVDFTLPTPPPKHTHHHVCQSHWEHTSLKMPCPSPKAKGKVTGISQRPPSCRIHDHCLHISFPANSTALLLSTSNFKQAWPIKSSHYHVNYFIPTGEWSI